MALPSSDLLNDAFTLLCFLYACDIVPRRTRFMPPTALAQLNRHLIIQDKVITAPHRKAGGKRGTTERETERIRFTMASL